MKRARRVKGYHWLRVVHSAYTRALFHCMSSKIVVNDVMCKPNINLMVQRCNSRTILIKKPVPLFTEFRMVGNPANPFRMVKTRGNSHPHLQILWQPSLKTLVISVKVLNCIVLLNTLLFPVTWSHLSVSTRPQSNENVDC